MSAWTNFRNSIEAIVEPEIQEGITFFKTLETLALAEGENKLEAAAVAGYTAAEATPGTFEAKALAALTAFGSALIGSAVMVVKQAETQTEAAVAPPAA